MQAAAAARAIELNLPFALFALPSDTEYRFFASTPDEKNGNALNESHLLGGQFFFATKFCAPLAMASVVTPQMTDREVMALPADTDPFPPTETLPGESSTPFCYYAAEIHRAVAEMKKHRMDKVVLSRLIAEHTDRHPVQIAEEYFKEFPGTFRAIFFTQETGLWITATPELLLSDTAIEQDDDSSEPSDGGEMPVSRFESMALAGTRSASGYASEGLEWDSKNTVEHDTVLRYVTGVFRENGLEPDVTDEKPLTFGEIEHKLHRITAIGRCNSLLLADELSPTPALAGEPLKKAVPFIARSEQHDRDCYGGLVGMVKSEEMQAYVNIRCTLMASEPSADGLRTANIFAGGGIMADSDYRAEWVEAARKAMPLCRLINPESAGHIADIPSRWLDC